MATSAEGAGALGGASWGGHRFGAKFTLLLRELQEEHVREVLEVQRRAAIRGAALAAGAAPAEETASDSPAMKARRPVKEEVAFTSTGMMNSEGEVGVKPLRAAGAERRPGSVTMVDLPQQVGVEARIKGRRNRTSGASIATASYEAPGGEGTSSLESRWAPPSTHERQPQLERADSSSSSSNRSAKSRTSRHSRLAEHLEQRLELGFLPLEHWVAEPKQSRMDRSKSSLGEKPKFAQTHSPHSRSSVHFDPDLAPSVCHCFIATPGSNWCFIWGWISLLLIIYDVGRIPLALAFPGRPLWITEHFEPAARWVVCIWWSLDLLENFRMGYVERGVHVMRFRRIARHYLARWFSFDLLLVLLGWLSLAVSTANREFHPLEAVGLLRIIVYPRVAKRLDEYISSELLEVLINVVKLLSLVLVIAHVIACLWYAIGDQHRADDWVSLNGLDETSFEYRYSTALHWALTKLMLESMDVEPQNFPERRFAVTMQIFGLVIFSSTISRITTCMIQLQSLRDHKSKQFWLLRRYLRERAVEPPLAMRIQRYLRYMVIEKMNHVQTSSVTILALLSNQLKDELNYAVSVPHIAMHPFFAHMAKVSDVTVFRLLGVAAMQLSLARDDSLFFAGELSTTMFFVLTGRMQYVEETLQAVSPEQPIAMTNSESPLARSILSRPRSVTDGDWMCEHALWTEWVHIGDLHATTETTLICMNQEKFGAVMCANYSAWRMASSYCHKFLAALNVMALHELCDLGGGTKEQDVLASFIQDYKGQLMSRRTKSVPFAPTWSLPGVAGAGGGDMVA